MNLHHARLAQHWVPIRILLFNHILRVAIWVYLIDILQMIVLNLDSKFYLHFRVLSALNSFNNDPFKIDFFIPKSESLSCMESILTTESVYYFISHVIISTLTSYLCLTALNWNLRFIGTEKFMEFSEFFETLKYY